MADGRQPPPKALHELHEGAEQLLWVDVVCLRPNPSIQSPLAFAEICDVLRSTTEHGVCGGCIVSIDGAQEHACQVTCGDIAGKAVTTIEGLKGPVAEALFAAWERIDVSQCGFCQPAQIMSASILLAHNIAPSDDDIDEAMKHNLCRCGTYARIRQAVHIAAATLRLAALEAA